VTVEGVTPAFTASARHDNPARTRDRARRSPTILLADSAKHTAGELAELFNVARSTVYRAIVHLGETGP
jgi:predicted DNA-binding transcriptional regulator YafY